jgi:hypothetical protein
VSYDIAKDSEKVAVLTFVKPAYRLGETVLGVVELNDASAGAKVLKVGHGARATRTRKAECTLPTVFRLIGKYRNSTCFLTLQIATLSTAPSRRTSFVLGPRHLTNHVLARHPT